MLCRAFARFRRHGEVHTFASPRPRQPDNNNEGQDTMAKINTPQELFVAMLSNVMHREEKLADILAHIAGVAQDADIKQAIDSRVFLREQMVSALYRCFKLIDAQPIKPETRLHDVFVEDFKREVAAIEGPLAKRLFVLAKINHLVHLHVGEYIAMTAMADIT